jgi:hypothetical protein
MRITIEIDDADYDALAKARDEYGMSTEEGGANEGDEGDATYATLSPLIDRIRHAMNAAGAGDSDLRDAELAREPLPAGDGAQQGDDDDDDEAGDLEDFMRGDH